MKGMIVDVYQSKRGGNFSNGGISSWAKEVLLVGPGIPEIFDARPGLPLVEIKSRVVIGERYIYAGPIEAVEPGHVGWMFGGCFIFTSDGRFPSQYPIPLHDRQESAALNEALSS